MKGLFTSIVLLTFLFSLGNGLPVAESVPRSESSTESASLYNSKSETVAVPVDSVDANILVDASVASVDDGPSDVTQDKTYKVAEASKLKDSDVPSISVSVEEKKKKKGKSDEGKVQVVKKEEPVVAEVSEVAAAPVVAASPVVVAAPVAPLVKSVAASSPVSQPDSIPVQTETPSQYSAEVTEESLKKLKNPEVASVVAASAEKVEPAKAVEVKNESSSSEISAYLAEPINQATKLLVDLEEQIKGYLNTDLGDAAASTLSPQSYGAGSNEPEIEPSPTDARQNEQITGMVDQIDQTIQNLDQSIEDLMANRRYMTAAMMRSMRSYLKGVQNNLQRLQNRLRALQAVASSANAPPADEGAGGAGGATGAFPSNAFFESLRVRVNRITSDITNLMNRMRSTLVSSTTARPSNG